MRKRFLYSFNSKIRAYNFFQVLYVHIVNEKIYLNFTKVILKIWTLLGQAKEYIQYLEKENHLKILKASDKKLFSGLQEALAQNTPLLIEEVFGELDYVLSKFKGQKIGHSI